jgi:hypothetical protein
MAYLLVERLTTQLCIPSLALGIASLPLSVILLLPTPMQSIMSAVLILLLHSY